MPKKITQYLNKQRKPVRCLLLLMLPAAAVLLFLGITALYRSLIAPLLPPCLLRTFTGLRCPACGMTHSAYAMTRGDFADAFAENAIIPVLALTGVLWYLGRWKAVLTGGTDFSFLRRGKFWVGVLIAALLYALIRNLI